MHGLDLFVDKAGLNPNGDPSVGKASPSTAALIQDAANGAVNVGAPEIPDHLLEEETGNEDDGMDTSDEDVLGGAAK